MQLNLRRRKERWFYLLVSPWLVGFLVLHVLPTLATALLSVLEWELPGPPRFAGMGHFSRLLSDKLFGRALANTVYLAGVSVPFSISLGLTLAVLLYRRTAGVRFFRTIFLLPAIVPGVATALTWAWIFNPRYGLVNAVLAMVGIRGPGWLYDQQWAMPVVILIHLWTAGINMAVYLAAMQNLPGEIYDAARIDGASSWRRFLHLTWPLLSPVTLYLGLVNLIGAFQVFTPVYILTGGGPNNATLTLPLYIYLNAFKWGDLGYAAALALVLLAIVLGMTAFFYLLTKRSVSYAR